MNITAKTSLLLDVMNGANVLTDEANFHLSADGLAFRSMDPSHIAMIDVLIPPTDFAKYEVTDGVKFVLRTQEVAKILKRFDEEEELNLSLDGEHLIISNQGKTFKTRTLEASGGDTPIPKLNFTAKLEGNREAIAKALGDVQVTSDYATFESLADEKFQLSGKGDRGEVTVVPDTDFRGFEGEGKATYSLDLLMKMINAVKSMHVTAEFGNKLPLKLSMGRISYFLAPRVAE